MAGPAPEVHVPKAVFDRKPKPPVLKTPESAVRSYLDWISYAYRIGEARIAAPAMTPGEWVRVDAYVQYNVEQKRLIDQALKSITFGTAKVKGSRATLPAHETWTYRYVSIETAGKTLRGPYSAKYDTTYTLTKTDKGWVVDKVSAEALGTVK